MPVKNGRWWLTQDSRQIVINASASHLYDLVADLPRVGEWSPECERVDWDDKTAIPGEGARFVRPQPGRAVPAVPLVASRPCAHRFSRPGVRLRHRGGRARIHRVALRVEPVEGGTRVTESYEVRWIPAWARVVDVPTNRHRELHNAMRHTLERLKATAEAGASTLDI
jgi:hypothetical protein